jgi:hypothetical protein
MEPEEYKAYLAKLTPEELLKIIENNNKEIRDLKAENKKIIEAIDKEKKLEGKAKK